MRIYVLTGSLSGRNPEVLGAYRNKKDAEQASRDIEDQTGIYYYFNIDETELN